MKRLYTLYTIGKLGCVALLALILFSCSRRVEVEKHLAQAPVIFPDYREVTVPRSIAPLHFRVEKERGEVVSAKFSTECGKVVEVDADGNDICIGDKDWQQLLQEARSISVEVVVNRDGVGCAYRPFHIEVSRDAIDPYIAYRLIEPGYEKWYKMGIYQRELNSYEQTPVIENSQTENNCMNCHSFQQHDPKRMLVHLRGGSMGGTYVAKHHGDLLEKLRFQADGIKSLVYPSWHPSGKFIAFSTNDTHQGFRSSDKNRIEVYDKASDIVVVSDIEQDSCQIITSPLLSSKGSWETYPCFSPDGRLLYFSTADSVEMPRQYKEVRYSVCSLAFDPAKKTFGSKVDTLFSARMTNKSAVMPRISPDGKWMVVTVADYGCFPIWHHEADLYIINLKTKEAHPLTAANSQDTESYHSWSSNGRWLLFGSRRVNGLYTMPYICHVDGQGRASKPFLLPQESPDFYDKCLKSFNIPEFVKGKCTLHLP